MKILYIGPYRQADGWGLASKEFLKALLLTGNEVSARPVYMANNRSIINDEDIIKAEKTKLDSYDICIQQVLPTMFEYNGNIKKNIGMFFSETSNLQNTPWIKFCNLMDEIWVSSSQEVKNLTSSGVKKTIKKIYVPVDTDKFNKNYIKIDLPVNGKPFIFYFIGEHINRKNLTALILAFHLEFGLSEQVELLIKTNKGGVSSTDLNRIVSSEIYQIKQSFGIYRNPSDYKKELLFTDYLSEENLYRLHNTCDCFVMPSHGEAWCIPAIDALGFGNTPIICDNTGMTEFINKDNGWVVPSTEYPVLGVDRPIDYLYRGRETWVNINIQELRKAMREAFINKKTKSVHKDSVSTYNYKKIAEQINESIT